MPELTSLSENPPEQVSFRDRLSFKQTKLAVLIALILGLVMSVIEGYIDFNRELSKSHAISSQIVNSAREPAALAAYSLDPQLGERVIAGLFEYDTIVLVEIFDENDKVFAGANRVASVDNHSWFVDYFFDETLWSYNTDLYIKDQAKAIGRLSIGVHPEKVFGGFIARWMTTVALEIFRNLLLALILAVAFYLLITRALEKITHHVNTFTSRSQPLPIDGFHHRDEIGALITSVNRHFELRRKSDEALKHSEERFRDFAQSSSDWLWEMDADLRFTYISDNVRKLGLEPSAFYGKTRQDLANPNSIDLNFREHLQTLENHLPFRDFIFLREIEGQPLSWTRTSGLPIFDEHSNFLGYRGTASDISLQKAAEQQALLLTNAIDVIDIGFSIWDPEDRFLRCNQTFRSWLAGVEDLLVPGTPFAEIFRALVERGLRPEAIGREEDWLHKRLKTRPKPNEPVVFVVENSEGVWIESHEFCTADNFKLTIGLDISQRKREETWLLNSEERLSMALEASKSGYWIRDLRSGEIFWSDENFKIFGYEPKSVKPSFEAWANKIHPDDRDVAVSKFLKALEDRSEFDFEYRILLPNGTTRWLENIGKSILDSDGTALVATGLQIDITDRKFLEEHLYQAHKMESIGHLTGGIAHDFNNILSVVIGNLELVMDMASDDKEVVKRTKIAHSGAMRGADLTQKLLNFSRTEASGQKNISPNQIIRDLQELIEKSLPATIELNFDLAADVWQIRVNSGDLEDALLNIVLNARDAIAGSGQITITTSNRAVGVADEGSFGTLVPGDYVEITLSDTGSGMTPEIRAKIFDPFFTTKDRGKGTGLGMSMVYGFADRSGGHVAIQSAPGMGTSVCLLLPRTQAEIDMPRKQEDAQAPLPTGNEAILIVDDEEQVSEYANIVLTSLGYKTYIAHSSEQALKILSEIPELDLLFSDVIMPGNLSGYDLAFEALSLNANLKILLTTGFDANQKTNQQSKDNLVARLANTILKKPYRKSDLALSVREALDLEVSDD